MVDAMGIARLLDEQQPDNMNNQSAHTESVSKNNDQKQGSRSRLQTRSFHIRSAASEGGVQKESIRKKTRHAWLKPGAWRMLDERAELPKAPRPPLQATARPNREDVHISGCGRDEAFRVVGFSPYDYGERSRLSLLLTKRSFDGIPGLL